MRHHDMDKFDDQQEKKSSSSPAHLPSGQRSCLIFGLDTQEEQDAEDRKARKRAMENLVSSWQERLQLISVIVRSRTVLYCCLMALFIDYFFRLDRSGHAGGGRGKQHLAGIKRQSPRGIDCARLCLYVLYL
jgi:hypothetical protein